MHTTSFVYVHLEEIPSFITHLGEPAPLIDPPPVPPALSSEEIDTLSLLSESTVVHQPETPPTQPTRLICLQSTDTQRKNHNSHLFGKPYAFLFCFITVQKQYIISEQTNRISEQKSIIAEQTLGIRTVLPPYQGVW